MPPDKEEILTAQTNVFEAGLGEAHPHAPSTDEESFKFVIENSPFFRHFADHLSPEDWEVFRAASNGDLDAVRVVLRKFKEFRDNAEEQFAHDDPEAFTAFMDALDGCADDPTKMNTVWKILEADLEMHEPDLSEVPEEQTS